MHVIAPIKKQANTSFSCNCNSFDGRERRNEASPMKATTPEKNDTKYLVRDVK